MLKSAIFVFLFSSFLGRLDCAGKSFVPVGINLSDHQMRGIEMLKGSDFAGL